MIDSSSNSTYGVSIAELKVPAGEKSSPRAHSTDKIYRWCTAEQIMVCSYVRIIARNFAQSQEHLFSRTPLFVVPSLSQPLRPLTHSPQGNLPHLIAGPNILHHYLHIAQQSCLLWSAQGTVDP
jgi:hypothetical protein